MNRDVYRLIVSVGEKICECYCEQGINYNASILKRDINTLITVLSSFFNKKAKSFNQNERALISILIQHFSSNFLQENILEACQDMWVYVLY